MHRFPSLARVQTGEALRLARGMAVICGRHTSVEVDRLALDAVGTLACAQLTLPPALDRKSEKKSHVRARKCFRPAHWNPAPTSLVRKSRVVVAVGDDDPAKSQGGRDHLLQQLPAGGHEEVHLG